MKRRHFLQATTATAILPSLFGGFPMKAFAAPSVPQSLLGAAPSSDRVLVIVQLNGGNDGLNTVIPIDQFESYDYVRPNIAIARNKILSLEGNNKTGFHPAMTGMQNLFNEGRLSVVQSVGIPSPTFSHFRDAEVWMSASDTDKIINSGWAGRYLSMLNPSYPNGYPNINNPDPLAIQMGSNSSLTLQGPLSDMSMCLTDPNSFYNFINNIEEKASFSPSGEELKYIRSIAKTTLKYGEVIKRAAAKVTNQGSYPETNLASQLKVVARLIKGGLKTRIYVVSAFGYDTHASQKDVHANLLFDLSESIKAFTNDCKNLGIEDRVLGMTFSEFGRRIMSNASAGTDHGAAAPMFLFGKHVKPGITGVNPIIPGNATVYDNIPFQYDFRSIYASVLKDWFCVNDADVTNILYKDFQPVSLIKDPSCTVSAVNGPLAADLLPEAEEQLLSNYPNPFVQSTKITFKTDGGTTIIQVMDTMGRVVKVLTDKSPLPGKVTVEFDSHGLPPGVYYARLQNGATSGLLAMLKVR
jgi:uncharacterized protein (DUF1501 family)